MSRAEMKAPAPAVLQAGTGMTAVTDEAAGGAFRGRMGLARRG